MLPIVQGDNNPNEDATYENGDQHYEHHISPIPLIFHHHSISLYIPRIDSLIRYKVDEEAVNYVK
jgi:hypothetical protein